MAAAPASPSGSGQVYVYRSALRGPTVRSMLLHTSILERGVLAPPCDSAFGGPAQAPGAQRDADVPLDQCHGHDGPGAGAAAPRRSGDAAAAKATAARAKRQRDAPSDSAGAAGITLDDHVAKRAALSTRGDFPGQGFGATEWVQELPRARTQGAVPAGFRRVLLRVPLRSDGRDGGAVPRSEHGQAWAEDTLSLREFVREWVASDVVAAKVLGHPACPSTVAGIALSLERDATDGAVARHAVYLPVGEAVEDDDSLPGAVARRRVVDTLVRAMLSAETAARRAGIEGGSKASLALDGERLKGATASTDAGELTAAEVWAVWARLLSWPGPELAAFDAKLLFYPALQACPSLAGGARPVADVLLAAWMLDPDAVANGVARSRGDAAPGGGAAERSRQITLHDVSAAYGVELPPAVLRVAPAGGAAGRGAPGSGAEAGDGAVQLRSLAGHLAMLAAVWRCLRALLSRSGMLPAFWGQEAALPCTLASIEVCGMAFDPEPLTTARSALTALLASLKAEANELAGGEFMITSNKEVAEVLYERLGLVASAQRQAYKARGPAKRMHKTTNEATLLQMQDQHPLPAVILAHRKANKSLTTYVEPFLKHRTRARIGVPARFLEARRPVPPALSELGLPPPSAPLTHEAEPLRLYSALLQTCTATGRLSSRFPNTQNLPKKATEIGTLRPPATAAAAAAASPAGEAALPQSLNVRSALRASAPNRELVSVDYGQIEMRLLAHFAGDPAFVAAANPEMAAASLDPGYSAAASSGSAGQPDIYQLVAAQCFSVAPASVTASQRQQAKTCCLGFMYGQGKADAARKLGVTPAEAGAVQQSLRTKFPGIVRFLASARSFAKAHGWVPTVIGRRRLLPGIRSANQAARSQAERQCVNAIIQGSAADVIKSAMLLLGAVIAAARDAVFGPPLSRECIARAASQPPASVATPASQTAVDAAGFESAGTFRGVLAPFDGPTVWTLAHCDVVHQIHDELVLDIPSAPGGAGGAGTAHRGRVCRVLERIMTDLAPAAVERIGAQWLQLVQEESRAGRGAALGGDSVARLVDFAQGFRCRFPVRFAAGPTYGSLVDL
ncbi:hypothetical protein FNF28_02094 [Cafeteria roenbergensis]|uniref:DNA-directed DNA polymerase n=1 Tax=Cafeteria roenbergensis TaxID=33653 RepID=A0A5A8DVH8_CAFRO|nr:hypothetical protein FNF28_02094 [Cafeteria roenbergensis]